MFSRQAGFGDNYSSAKNNLKGSENSSTLSQDSRNRQIQNLSMPVKKLWRATILMVQQRGISMESTHIKV
jgi:hypothetical protein